MTNDREAVELFGKEAISFIAATTVDELDAHLSGSTQLPQTKAAVVAEMLVVGRELLAQTPHAHLLLGRLCEPRGTLPSFAVDWMDRSGQRIVPAVSSDPVIAAIRELAAATYPALLMTITPQPLGHSTMLFAHPAAERFQKAVRGDAILTQLAPERSDQSGHHGSYYDSTGTGGGLQLSLLGSILVTRAWDLALARGGGDFTDLEQAIDDLTAALRAAIVGKSATVPMAIGLTGLLLPKGLDHITLPFGTLRRATAAHRRLHPFLRSGVLQTTTESGDTVTMDYAGDLVLVTDIDYRLVLGKRDLGPDWPTPMTSDTAEAHADTIALAAALGITRQEPVVVAPTWRVAFSPLSHGGGGWRDGRDYRGLLPIAATVDETNALREWAVSIHAGRTSELAVGIRRTLSALRERSDPADSLVDLVIAWENLFGADTELRFRISAALARLLGNTPAQRSDIQARAGKLYVTRSKIVHGDSVATDKIVDDSRAARGLTLDMWRALFRDQPELLADTDRAKTLLLQ